ncbi:MAG: methyltransferase [Solirubrobacteraceae bacterium]
MSVTRTRPRLDLRAFIRLTELADYFIPFTIRAVAELGVADLLADGPRTVEELAADTGTHAPSLRRALRALACKGVFAELQDGRFALTPTAELLRSDHPLSLRDAYHLMPSDVAAWAHLDHSVRTGEPAFDHVHGRSLWSWLAEHPADGERFDRGMQSMTRLELRGLTGAYDWSGMSLLVDVGGGNGALLAGLLAQHPGLRGRLFDLPHVVAAAGPVLAGAGVADRCEVHPGSFFDAVPPGGDAYLLKRILYGWNDEGARRILRSVRAAMGRQARMLVIEPVAGVADPSGFSATLDLVMLAVDGGRARTVEELSALLCTEGLRLTRTVPTMMFPIVEARPA